MRFLKESAKSIFRQCGYEVVPKSDTPLLDELTWARNELRRTPGNYGDAIKRFSHALDDCHLAWLLDFLAAKLVIDVGANHGQFATSCRRLGFRGRIVSFEPTRALAARLRQSAAADPDWQIVAKALGAAPGEAHLRVFGEQSFNSLHDATPAGGATFPDYLRPAGSEVVSVSTLSAEWPACLAGLSSPRCLLKTDTQGHDLEVLRGAATILPQVAAVVCEAAMTPLYADAPDYHATFAFLEANGFVLSGVYPVAHLGGHPGLIEVNAFFIRRPEAGI